MNIAAQKPTRAVQTGLAISLLTLVAGAWLVLRWWYPQAFWNASGLLDIAPYALLAHLGITVLLLLPWRNRSKEPGIARSDAALLVFVMLCAALFSLSYLFAGRPVALVFAVDRVALVRANEVRTSELALVGTFGENLRISGPLKLIGARQSSDAERLDSIQLAMAGFDLHQRPGFWVPLDAQRDLLKQKSRDIGELAGFYKTQAKWATFLPLAGGNGNWVLLLDSELKTFAPFKID